MLNMLRAKKTSGCVTININSYAMNKGVNEATFQEILITCQSKTFCCRLGWKVQKQTQSPLQNRQIAKKKRSE